MALWAPPSYSAEGGMGSGANTTRSAPLDVIPGEPGFLSELDGNEN